MPKLSFARRLTLNLILGLAYVLLGKAGQLLALPPGYVTLVWLPAGLAVAACLLWGTGRIWPGIALGPLGFSAAAGSTFEPGPVPLIMAFAAITQAVICARSLRRVDPHLEFDNGRNIAFFIATSMACCLIATTVGNATLYTFGTLTRADLASSWFAWWLGDTLGILILLPLAMAAFDPRPLWRRRRLHLGIPLFASVVICALMYVSLRGDETHHLVRLLTDQAESVLGELDRTADAAGAVEILAGLNVSEANRTPARFADHAAVLRKRFPMLRTLSWVPFVRAEERTNFEREISALSGRGYLVHAAPGHALPPSGWMAPIALIEPLTGNQAALGVDLLSEPIRAQAIERARNMRTATVSDKIALVQDLHGPGALAIVAPVVAAGTPVGVITGVINLRDLLKPLNDLTDVQWQLSDTASGTLLGRTLVQEPSFGKDWLSDERGIWLARVFNIAEREYQLIFFKPYAAFAPSLLSGSSLVLLMALVVTSGLCMFMMLVSAHGVRTEKTVAKRTEQLRSEIARRDAAAAALRISERSYRQLVDTAQEGIWVVDQDNITTMANPRMGEILGWPPEDLIGTTMHDHMDSTSEASVSAFNARRREGIAEEHELAFRRRDGAIVWALVASSPLYDEQGCYSGALAMAIDITERKRAADEVVATKTLLQNTIDGIPFPVFVKNPESLLLLVNQAFERQMGRPAANFLGTDGSAFLPPEQVAAFLAIDRAAFAKRQHFELEENVWNATLQETRPHRTFKNPVFDTEGRPLYLICATIDISEQKRVQEELIEARDAAQTANRAKSEFLSSMSHELRTPLNAILGFAQLLGLEDSLADEPRQYTREIKRAGSHLLTLVNDLIDLARIESQKIEVTIEALNLAALLSDSMGLVAPIAAARGIELVNRVSGSVPQMVLADYTRLHQIVINLLSNAIKYNRPQGKVILNCSQSDQIGRGKVRVSVTDTGPGIPADKQNRLFTAFDRLGAECSDVEGSGIGLVITRRVAYAMACDVGFSSCEGEGSTFWVDVPLAESTDEHERVRVLAVREASARADDDAVRTSDACPVLRPVVLYIEDAPSSLRFMRTVFARWSAIELRDSHSAEIGISLAQALQPVLILMDINLPGMDGYTALACLKDNPLTMHIPVVAITANAMKGEMDRGLEAGFSGYLVKPIDIALIGRILEPLIASLAAASGADKS